MARIQLYIPDELYRRAKPFLKKRLFSVSAMLRPVLEAKVRELEKEQPPRKGGKKRGSPNPA